MSIIMQAMTTTDTNEVLDLVAMLVRVPFCHVWGGVLVYDFFSHSNAHTGGVDHCGR